VKLRESILARLRGGAFDVLVLGGGINGAVSAACLAARGVKVALVDRGDFAGETSQESSNLAWGGIKYLEGLEVGLVEKLCRSRNELMRAYPSTVQEIRFLTTHARGFRHGLPKLVAGAWFYWALGRGFTRPPRRLSLAALREEEPLLRLDGADGGFEYSDAYLHDNDARFVWGFVREALDHGAAAANYVESLGARRDGEGWTVAARDVESGTRFEIRARVLVNACGPWVDEHNVRAGAPTRFRHVFSKGIHLVVPRIGAVRRVLTFFADDGRLFFAIPMGSRTCVGTTDTQVAEPHTAVTPDDRRFVLANLNKRLALPRPLSEADVIAERCGVRPLAVEGDAAGGDWLALSRRHVVEVDRAQAHVSIFGGKLTDCLNVGQEVFDVVRRLGVDAPHPRRPWYGEPQDARREYLHQAEQMDLDARTSPRASEPLTPRLWRRYGRDALQLLDAIRRDAAMAELLIEGAEYLRCEIELAARREMVTRLADFLRRRSKIALVLRADEIRRAPGLREAAQILFGADADARIDEYFAGARAPRAAGAAC
jgi:glycerol-3-phosphate dehydrogenase